MRINRRTLITFSIGALLSACRGQETQPAGVLDEWFHHIERNEIDSLRPLLSSDFVFVSDGRTWSADSFVAMIRGLGIRNPRVELTNVVSHEHGDVAYLLYQRDETFETGGQVRTVPETGTLVLTRQAGRWQIAQWAATSPP